MSDKPNNLAHEPKCPCDTCVLSRVQAGRRDYYEKNPRKPDNLKPNKYSAHCSKCRMEPVAGKEFPRVISCRKHGATDRLIVAGKALAVQAAALEMMLGPRNRGICIDRVSRCITRRGRVDMNFATARTLGQVETEVYAGRMDLDQAVGYMIANCEVDADDLDHVRERLHETARERTRES